jgi:glucose/arabinose dehydrogenase
MRARAVRLAVVALVLSAGVASAIRARALQPAPEVETVATGLVAPWAIDFAPDGRAFISERPGRVRVLREGRLEPEPWITLDVVEAGESGLMGLAVDPQFSENGFIYVAYTYRGPGRGFLNRLVRLKEDPATGGGVEDAILLDGIVGNTIHDGGRVKFGPDGKLYWTMGEAGMEDLAQDLSSLNGKILRLNPDGTVPSDNPFPGSPVFSYGHRNPQGLAWQPGTGRLFATEHGPSGLQLCCRDEVNAIEAGMNYGWPLVSGDERRAGTISPVLQSGATNTWAPGGATFVSAGPWQGSLVFTGLRGEALYRLALSPGDPATVLDFQPFFGGRFGRLRDVVEGPDGALYVLTSNRDGRGRPSAADDRVLRITVR